MGESGGGITISLKDYGNVPNRILDVKLLTTELESSLPLVLIYKNGIAYLSSDKTKEPSLNTFPDKYRTIFISKGKFYGSNSRVGVKVNYVDLDKTKDECGLIIDVGAKNIGKGNEWP